MKKVILLFLFALCIDLSDATSVIHVMGGAQTRTEVMISAEEVNNTIQFYSGVYLIGSEVQLVDNSGNVVLSEYIVADSSMDNYIDITGVESGTYTINLFKGNTEYTGEMTIN